MYSGYFLKINDNLFPQNKIVASGYKATPQHRLDISSDRNAEGGLLRDVAENRPSSVSVTLNCENNREWGEISELLYGNMISENEKSMMVTFYDPERDRYLTEKMYWSDTEYVIESADENFVYYDSITIELTGY